MIVRISTEGQYELGESDVDELNELDNRAVAACETKDEEQFRSVFNELLEFVRKHGSPVPDDRLEASAVILPQRRNESAGQVIPGSGPRR